MVKTAISAFLGFLLGWGALSPCVWGGTAQSGSSETVAPSGSQDHPPYNDVSPPTAVTLCGEPLPLEDRRVWESFDREFTIAVWNRAQVFLWLKRAGRYFPSIEAKLAAAGMPDDLKYLAVAESDLQSHARSPAGALGTWQFMEHTARRHGLAKNQQMDERRNFERATAAALSYLQALRIERAKEILEQTRKGVDQIACEVGYRDSASFRRLFTRLTSVTPAQYRRRFRGLDR
jgi:AraC-like DNA-binding protein